MARQARRGRPAKSYTTSWGETINGLARGNDGRWRIIATGQRFTEADERRAKRAIKRAVKHGVLSRVDQWYSATDGTTDPPTNLNIRIQIQQDRRDQEWE